MKIIKVSAIPMSAPVPTERRHRTDLGTKIKSDATLIRVETDDGHTGMGAALGTPADCHRYRRARASAGSASVRTPCSPNAYTKQMQQRFAQHASTRAWHNTSRRKPTPRRNHGGDCGRRHSGVGRKGASTRHTALPSARRGAQLGAWLCQWRCRAPGDEAEAELAGYAAKGFTAAKMRVVGRDGFSIANCVRRVTAARRGLGPTVELMIDAHGSLEVATAIKLARELEPYDIPGSRSP